MRKNNKREKDTKHQKLRLFGNISTFTGQQQERTSIIQIIGTRRDTLFQNTTLEGKYYHTMFCCLKDALYLE